MLARLASGVLVPTITLPQLLFLKVSNEIQLETDLTFVRQ
jgi:hypothetical protein